MPQAYLPIYGWSSPTGHQFVDKMLEKNRSNLFMNDKELLKNSSFSVVYFFYILDKNTKGKHVIVWHAVF